jgi:hypothetical protein
VGDLDLPTLPPAARIVHIFPELGDDSLLSIGQLCDAGCEAHFSKSTATITYNDQVVLTGARTTTQGLWRTAIPPNGTGLPHKANAATHSATPAELVAFAHATLGSPALSTLCTALDNNYITGFPGLTSKLVRKYPPRSIAMAKGHLDQTRKNTRTTKTPTTTSEPTADESNADDTSPTPDPFGTRTHHLYAACTPITGQVYTDQTGRFITPSSTGNNYLLILYDYDSNSIHVEPLRNCTGGEILAAYKRVHTRLCTAGLPATPTTR